MTQHVAILHKRYLRLILDGSKTVESRMTATRRPPFGRVSPGDVIFFKCSSGPFMARAVAGKVESFADLTPDALMRLCDRYDGRVCAGREYWRAKGTARYATFIELTHVRPVTAGPVFPKSHGLAWFVLDL